MKYEPGIYDLPFVDYLKIDAMNFHTLKELEISPLHLKHVIDGYRQPNTDALRLGRAIHCGVLTPSLFKKEHHISPGCAAKMKSGARKGEDCGKSSKWSEDGVTFFCGTHAKGDSSLREFDNVLTEAEGENITNVVDAVKKHAAGECLRKGGTPEQSIVFDRLGVRCKARIDWLLPGEFVDLKKLQRGKADDRSLLQAIVKYDYYQQLAFYAAAVNSIQGDLPNASLLFCEDAAPYDVTLLPFDEQAIHIGLAEIDQLLERYKRCRDEDRWPGVFESAISFETGLVKRGGLPKWKRDEAVASGLVDEDTWPTEALRGIDAPPVLTGFDEE